MAAHSNCADPPPSRLNGLFFLILLHVAHAFAGFQLLSLPLSGGLAQLLPPPPRPTPFPSGSWQQPVSMSGTLPNLKTVFNPGKALLHGVSSKLNPAVWTPRFYDRDGLKGAIFVIWLWDITITFLSYRNCLNDIIRKGLKTRGLQFHVS